MVPPELTRRNLFLPRNDHESATLVLERLGDCVELRLNLRNSRVDLPTLIFGVIFSFLGFCLEFLIFGSLFCFRLGFAGVLANALEVRGVATDKFALHAAPWSLRVSLVPQSPHGRNHQQERADEDDRAC